MIVYMYGNFLAYSTCVHQVLKRLLEVVYIHLAYRLLKV